MAFSQTRALNLLGVDAQIVNTVDGVAATMIRILIDQGYEVNEIELKRWCEFHFIRTSLRNNIQLKETVGVSSLCRKIRVYLNKWYATHLKWLRGMRS